MRRVDVEDVELVARAAVAAVDFLLDWLRGVRGREGVGEGEEDDVLREAAVAGSGACLSLWSWRWRCLCHLVK